MGSSSKTGTQLEDLPLDIVIQILKNAADYSTLKAAVHAAPIIHNAFLVAPTSIVKAIFQRQDGGLVNMSDAMAAIRSEGLSDRDELIALLDQRRRDLYKTGPESPAEYIKLLRFHERAIWLLEDLKQNIRRPVLIGKTEWMKKLPLKLSIDEKRRIIRGIYRLQIQLNVFGPLCPYDNVERARDRFRDRVFDAKDETGLFFMTMPPWEQEEINCARFVLWMGLLQKLGQTALKATLKQISAPGTRRPRIEIPFFPMESVNQVHYCLKNAPSEFLLEFVADAVQQDDDGVNCIYSDSDEDPDDAVDNPEYDTDPHSDGGWNSHDDIVSDDDDDIAEGIFEEPFEKLGPIRFTYPADQYCCDGNRGEFKKRLIDLPLEKQPNPGWLYIWSVIGYPQKRFLYSTLYVEDDPELFVEWAYAFWDRERLVEWAIFDRICRGV
ncbi:hypothetical protein BJX99DRAFT_263958 [Aspergillus californicus]